MGGEFVAVFIRRFIAKDMQEAIQKIRKDFGPDAVILDSKMVRAKGALGMFKKKQVEVVAAFEPNKGQPLPDKTEVLKAEETAEQTAPAKTDEQAKIEMLNEQLSQLKSTVADFANRIRIVDKDATLTFSPEILQLYNDLVDRDVRDDIAKEIATQAQEAAKKKSAEAGWAAQQIVLDRLGEPVPIKPKQFAQKVLLFAGPTGAGKTTTLVKLAGLLTFEQGLKVGLVNMDTYRVGAIEHIKIYSEIMNIPLRTAYNADELLEAIKSLEDRDVVLIDTAGKSAREQSYRDDIASFIKTANVDEVLLVISVVTGHKTCQEVVENYLFIEDYKLIITKLDEMGAWGNILNILDYAGKPMSYVTMGQEVPNDICVMDAQKISENIVFGQEVKL